MKSVNVLWTGQRDCYDSKGRMINCEESGQDCKNIPSVQWPADRFSIAGQGVVLDKLTGLNWTVDANPFSFAMSWQEGIEAIQEMNVQKTFGRDDWRLPNRRELRSLIDHSAKKPALPEEHPFKNVFLGWYWTSTSSAMAPGYAWYIHMEGGRMFYGRKDSLYLVWPVCGCSDVLLQTGAQQCFDESGNATTCVGSGQDAEYRRGIIWPEPRFKKVDQGVEDQLTGLIWYERGDIGQSSDSWGEALRRVEELTKKTQLTWRLPTINELESLVDASTHSPALPVDHPFVGVQEAYWSSTTSFFETDWAYVLYLHKGAVGVGFKQNQSFDVWPVRSPF